MPNTNQPLTLEEIRAKTRAMLTPEYIRAVLSNAQPIGKAPDVSSCPKCNRLICNHPEQHKNKLLLVAHCEQTLLAQNPDIAELIQSSDETIN